MNRHEFNVRAILAGEAPQDAPVTVKGWVRTRRDSKAGISFVHLSDGSAFHPVQVVGEGGVLQSDRVGDLALAGVHGLLHGQQHQPHRQRATDGRKLVVECPAEYPPRPGHLEPDRADVATHADNVVEPLDVKAFDI